MVGAYEQDSLSPKANEKPGVIPFLGKDGGAG